MINSKNTVGLVDLNGAKLVIDHDDYLTIAQSSDVEFSGSTNLAIGQVKLFNEVLPVYQLSELLIPISNQSELQQNRFCLGFKCEDQSDNFALLCNDFTQIDLSSVEYVETIIPEFMKSHSMPVSKLIVYAGETYLHTSSELLLGYLRSFTNESRGAL